MYEEQLLSALKQYWGYDKFRPMQQQIIESVIEGHDTLALMPTGGGKSITYQLPTMLMDGICIVVTPLIALMKDQVDRLRERGISAVAIHSGLTPRQIDVLLDNCVYGDVKFLYVAPERLATDVFKMRVRMMRVALLAVDEAHCISQWGYDFRPSYLRIAELREYLPETPVLALTASATEKVATDIMQNLRFEKPHLLRSSFARPNLSYVVRHVDDKNIHLMRIIRNVQGSGIVYVRLRESAERVAAYLQEQGESVLFYHGGLPKAERSERQDEWTSGKVRIMVATNAFGMGIDKADVRFVIHYAMCDSLESYYQEAGRAGRDGKRSYAVLLVAPDDNRKILQRFEKEFPKLDVVHSVYERICDYLKVAIGDGYQLSAVFNIYDFCSREHFYVGTVVSVLSLLEQNGYMTFVEENENPARIIFLMGRDELYRHHFEPNVEHVLRTVLRMYNGVFTNFRAIDEQAIAAAARVSVVRVHEALKTLWRMQVIRYVPSNNSPAIFFNEERLPTRDIYIAPNTYMKRKELMIERFENMLRYANNTEECRSVLLEQYFGDKNSKPCGVCDVCLSKRRGDEDLSHVRERVLSEVAEGHYTPHELVEHLAYDPDKVSTVVKSLLSEGRMCYTQSGELALVE